MGYALLSGFVLGDAADRLLTAALVIRTGLEDRTLQEELDGYRDYTARVRYRLLPGLW